METWGRVSKMGFWGALWRPAGLSYMQGVCSLASGREAQGQGALVSLLAQPASSVTWCPQSAAQWSWGRWLVTPQTMLSIWAPPQVSQCSSDHAREDLGAPKSSAQDKHRQPRLDFYLVYMAVEDSKAQSYLTGSFEIYPKNPKHLQNHCC